MRISITVQRFFVVLWTYLSASTALAQTTDPFFYISDSRDTISYQYKSMPPIVRSNLHTANKGNTVNQPVVFWQDGISYFHHTTNVANVKNGLSLSKEIKNKIENEPVFRNQNKFNSATSPQIVVSNVSPLSLCAGGSITVTFSVTGGSNNSTTIYSVFLQKYNGGNPITNWLTSGTSTTITCSMPYDADGTDYKLIVQADDPAILPGQSATLSIGYINTVFVKDRRTYPTSYASGTVCPGDHIILDVSTTGQSNIPPAVIDSYQWLFNRQSISGSTSATIAAQQSGEYTVIVGRNGCVLTSTQAYTLNSSLTQTTSVLGNKSPECAGSTRRLESFYPGSRAAIQWYKDGNTILGANQGFFASTQSGSYSYSVELGECRLRSDEFPLQFGANIDVNVYASDTTISPAFGGQFGNVGMFCVGDNSGRSWQWYRNGALLPGETTDYLNVNSEGLYTVLVMKGACSAIGRPVMIRQIAKPVIELKLFPAGVRTSCPGETWALGALIKGGYYVMDGYQWQKDDIDIPGATNYFYNAIATGTYKVKLTVGTNSIVSQALSLTISNQILPVVQANLTNCTSATLSVVNPSANTFRYQWFKSNIPIAGTTEPILNTSESGLYSVSMTNDNCTGLSRPILVAIGQDVKPAVTVAYYSRSQMCQHSAVRLESSSKAQWRRNGVAIPNEQGDIYYATQSGQYSVEEFTPCGTYQSDPVDVKIGEPTTATLTGNALVNAGQAAQLPVLFSGPAPWSFTLSNGQSVQNTYQNPYPLSVIATASGSYSIATVQNACGTGLAAGQATITVGSGRADLSLSAQVSRRTPRINDIITYSLLITNNGPQDAGGVQISSRLPTGVEFVDAVSPDVSIANGLVNSSVGAIVASNTAMVSYRLRITQPGTFFATAQVAAVNTPDPDSQPNSGTGDGEDDQTSVDLRTSDGVGPLVSSANPNQIPLARVLGNQPPTQPDKVELALAINSSSLTPKPGELISLSLIVSNRGGAIANTMVIHTLLPVGWQVTNSTGLIVAGQTVKAYVNQLAAGSNAVVVLPVQVGPSGSSTIQTQIADVAEPVSNATPGNGYQNGERDEASVSLKVR